MQAPVVDDRTIWDLWLSQYKVPLVLAADKLGLFEFLRDNPSTVDEIQNQLRLPMRSVAALTTSLAAMGFLVQHAQRLYLTQTARLYLLPDSDFYWVPMLGGPGYGQLTTPALMDHLRTENLQHDAGISRRWERGEIPPADARTTNQRMHSHSFPAALGLARTADFSGVQHLLDIAGGSGGYAIALALQFPNLRCTVADLPPVVDDARSYIARYGCQDRVDTYAFNMFDDPWPRGYDAILFTNILHDWDPERRGQLLRSSFEVLPSAGRVCIHEILLNDAQDGPLAAALFSVMMLGTRGKQFSSVELADMLRAAGFARVEVRPTYGYYSLVSGLKDG